MQTLYGFFEKLKRDGALSDRYNRLAEEKDYKALRELLKDNGVTAEDLKIAEQKIETMVKNGELSDKALEGAAGGSVDNTVLKILKKLF